MEEVPVFEMVVCPQEDGEHYPLEDCRNCLDFQGESYGYVKCSYHETEEEN